MNFIRFRAFFDGYDSDFLAFISLVFKIESFKTLTSGKVVSVEVVAFSACGGGERKARVEPGDGVESAAHRLLSRSRIRIEVRNRISMMLSVVCTSSVMVSRDLCLV